MRLHMLWTVPRTSNFYRFAPQLGEITNSPLKRINSLFFNQFDFLQLILLKNPLNDTKNHKITLFTAPLNFCKFEIAPYLDKKITKIPFLCLVLPFSHSFPSMVHQNHLCDIPKFLPIRNYEITKFYEMCS